jgi:glycosyltransferase involved in cell wall biosynthesis
MKPLRILHFSNYSPHRDEGAGIDRFLYWISKAQAQSGHSVTVFYQGVEKPLMVHPSVKLGSFFTSRNTAFTIAPELVRALVDRQFDFVHFHGAYRPSMWLLARQLRKRAIPYTITSHGLLSPHVQRKSDRLKKLIYRYFCQLPLMNQALFVHALSEGEKKDILQYGVRSPVEVIVQGFEHDHVPDPPRTNFFAQFDPHWERRCKLAFVGRIDVIHKGLDLLVSALAILKETLSDQPPPLVVLAGGDYEGQLAGLQEQVKEGGLEPSVHFPGPLGEKDKFELLQSCDFSVLTSRFEGFPISIVESLAVARPALVTRSTNVGEIVEETESGLVVSTDVNQIVGGLRRLLSIFHDADHYQRLQANAQKAARELFDWRLMARRLDENYARRIGLGKSSPKMEVAG